MDRTQYVQAALTRAAFILPTARTTIEKQDQTTTPQPGNTTPGSRPPANLEASEAAHEISRSLTTISGLLDRGYDHTTPPVVDEARNLDHWTSRLWQLVDHPPEGETLAPCTCGRALVAYRETGTVYCRSCGEVYDIEERRQKRRDDMEALDDMEGTLKQMCIYSEMSGRPVKMRTLRWWRDSGELKRVGETADGFLYRYGDVKELMDRRTSRATKGVAK